VPKHLHVRQAEGLRGCWLLFILPLTETGTADPSPQLRQGFIAVQLPLQSHSRPEGDCFGYFCIYLCAKLFGSKLVGTRYPTRYKTNSLLKVLLCSRKDGSLGGSLSHILP